jgi:hypothetical protein
MTQMNLPPLINGAHKPYRVWTSDLLPVDQLPRFEPDIDSPAFVTHDHSDWHVTFGAGRLYVARDGQQHQLHNTQYASGHDAKRAAYGAGLLGVMVYEDEAAWYGFPVA